MKQKCDVWEFFFFFCIILKFCYVSVEFKCERTLLLTFCYMCLILVFPGVFLTWWEGENSMVVSALVNAFFFFIKRTHKHAQISGCVRVAKEGFPICRPQQSFPSFSLLIAGTICHRGVQFLIRALTKRGGCGKRTQNGCTCLQMKSNHSIFISPFYASWNNGAAL